MQIIVDSAYLTLAGCCVVFFYTNSATLANNGDSALCIRNSMQMQKMTCLGPACPTFVSIIIIMRFCRKSSVPYSSVVSNAWLVFRFLCIGLGFGMRQTALSRPVYGEFCLPYFLLADSITVSMEAVANSNCISLVFILPKYGNSKKNYFKLSVQIFLCFVIFADET